ncbi:MAG: CRISPR-associated protein Csx14 [Candidatus Bathyarchaeia archaeon]
MCKVSVVAPLGTSPSVITEFLQYVESVLDQRVADITIITTTEPLVLEGLELIKAGIADRYPNIRIHTVKLPYDDVDSEERSIEFVNIAAKILRDQKEKFKADVVHLCVAGGRKEVCIILSLLAQFYNVNGVYHVVMPDVKTFNQQLERIRYEAKELVEAEDKLAYYRQKKKILEPVLFPELSTYNVIRIPVIPYPMQTLIGMKKMLERRKSSLHSIDMNIAPRLKELGYIKISRNYAYISADGEYLLHILRSVVK